MYTRADASLNENLCSMQYVCARGNFVPEQAGLQLGVLRAHAWNRSDNNVCNITSSRWQ